MSNTQQGDERERPTDGNGNRFEDGQPRDESAFHDNTYTQGLRRDGRPLGMLDGDAIVSNGRRPYRSHGHPPC